MSEVETSGEPSDPQAPWVDYCPECSCYCPGCCYGFQCTKYAGCSECKCGVPNE